MAKRETDKREAVKMLSEKIGERIKEMPTGSKSSISRLINGLLTKDGYENIHLGADVGRAWTKDGGKTYILSEDDLFSVLEETKKLLKGSCVLDFSEYKNKIVGLPFNLSFTVKRKNK